MTIYPYLSHYSREDLDNLYNRLTTELKTRDILQDSNDNQKKMLTKLKYFDGEVDKYAWKCYEEGEVGEYEWKIPYDDDEKNKYIFRVEYAYHGGKHTSTSVVYIACGEDGENYDRCEDSNHKYFCFGSGDYCDAHDFHIKNDANRRLDMEKILSFLGVENTMESAVDFIDLLLCGDLGDCYNLDELKECLTNLYRYEKNDSEDYYSLEELVD
jgi:hypothetical protein